MRFGPAQFSAFDCQPVRQYRPDSCNRCQQPFPHIRRTADNLEHPRRADIYLTDDEFIGIRMRAHRVHFADDDACKFGTEVLERVNFNAEHRQPFGEFAWGQREINVGS